MRHQFNSKAVIAANAFITFAVTTCAAQTQIDVSYSIREDIRIGRQAATGIEKQIPLLSERRLVESAATGVIRGLPSPYRQRRFVYRFDVVNVRDKNALAHPGGPLYVVQQAMGRGN